VSKKLLISTNIEKNYLKIKNFSNCYFLGYWCISDKFYKKKINKKTFNYEKNIWSNYRIQNKDYKYLNYLINRCCRILPKFFNKFHGTNFNQKYWKNFYFLWLTYYIPFQYYRWKVVNTAIKKNKNLFFLNFYIKNNFTPLDTIGFYNSATQSHLFNYYHFKRIIIFFKDKIQIKNVNKHINFNENKINESNQKKYFIFHFFIKKINFLLKIIIIIITQRNKILIHGGFRKIHYIFINILLKQFPLFLDKVFNWYEIRDKFILQKINIQKRYFMVSKSHVKNLFEEYIFNNIFKDIPYCYLEQYENLNLEANKINLKPDAVISFFYHMHNELFKFWLFNKNSTKSFYAACHGGVHQKRSNIFNYERLISKKYLDWIREKNNKINLPISKYIFLNRKRSQSIYLLYVAQEIEEFPCRISHGPTTLDLLPTEENLSFLMKNLDYKIKNKFFYSPLLAKIKKQNIRINEIIGENKFLQNNSFPKYLCKSKIVICSYPNTTFIDSLITGPTILVCDLKSWEPLDQLKPAYKLLIKSNIIFSDIAKATYHINYVWNDIHTWWNTPDTKKAVNLFLREFNLSYKQPIGTWVNFLKKAK
jgi:putative transferase (TIGR04331 family)